jgi:tetratricopeptide (TPR) repeat protein
VNTLGIAIRLNDEGRFTEALRALNDEQNGPTPRNARTEVLRAELLERVGRFGQARAILQALGKNRLLSPGERSSCEFIIGKIDWEEGSTESAIAHLQRSVQLATDAGDLLLKCWPSLWLLVSLTDRSGPNAAAHLLNEIRNDATKLGEPRVLAALHSFTAQMDAKRGLFTSAHWHITRSEQILSSAPNLWIEAQLEFTKTNMAALTSDHRYALTCGRHAVALAEESGGAACQRTCLGNLGFVFYVTGEFDKAVNCIERAIATLPSAGDNRSAMLVS